MKQKQKTSIAVSLVSGGTAGAVEAFATYPFEFAKTRGQLLKESRNANSNPVSLLVSEVKRFGIRSIYTGCSTLAVGATFKAGVRFMTYDSVKNALADEKGHLSPMRGILAGMLAGSVESIVAVTPTERIKTALIDDARSGQRQFRGASHALQLIIQRHGLPGLYRGLVSSTLKQSMTSATRMGSYNILKETAKRYNLPQNSAVTFGTGAVAGIITVYVTQPFDTTKTRAQSAKGETFMVALRSILSEGGVKGFWAGSTMRLGRLIFSGGIIFTVYEKVASTMHGF
ncbi:unnamed protein product [Clonostachys rosea f. rosea IK726]|uniref:Mitochondrial thiamine pyrophosphate carrier 1 n=2 Tax=Bionectria ochroleuca TaxID=29856 RepID=A0A0B7KIF4_BIOOC|nr:unnamed protein product [Clonostachys rosea f. rosea IK726]